jgi:hypothetical protein
MVVSGRYWQQKRKKVSCIFRLATYASCKLPNKSFVFHGNLVDTWHCENLCHFCTAEATKKTVHDVPTSVTLKQAETSEMASIAYVDLFQTMPVRTAAKVYILAGFEIRAYGSWGRILPARAHLLVQLFYKKLVLRTFVDIQITHRQNVDIQDIY